jgi:hypothetical protein
MQRVVSDVTEQRINWPCVARLQRCSGTSARDAQDTRGTLNTQDSSTGSTPRNNGGVHHSRGRGAQVCCWRAMRSCAVPPRDVGRRRRRSWCCTGRYRCLVNHCKQNRIGHRKRPKLQTSRGKACLQRCVSHCDAQLCFAGRGNGCLKRTRQFCIVLRI